jgi:hypothetical protein
LRSTRTRIEKPSTTGSTGRQAAGTGIRVWRRNIVNRSAAAAGYQQPVG